MQNDLSYQLESAAVIEDVVEFEENLWGKELIAFEGSYQQLMPNVKSCESVKLFFDSRLNGKVRSDILYTNGFEMIILNNLDEETWNWNDFVFYL